MKQSRNAREEATQGKLQAICEVIIEIHDMLVVASNIAYKNSNYLLVTAELAPLFSEFAP